MLQFEKLKNTFNPFSLELHSCAWLLSRRTCQYHHPQAMTHSPPYNPTYLKLFLCTDFCQEIANQEEPKKKYLESC